MNLVHLRLRCGEAVADAREVVLPPRHLAAVDLQNLSRLLLRLEPRLLPKPCQSLAQPLKWILICHVRIISVNLCKIKAGNPKKIQIFS